MLSIFLIIKGSKNNLKEATHSCSNCGKFLGKSFDPHKKGNQSN